MTDFLAMIATWVGDKDLASQQLADATGRAVTSAMASSSCAPTGTRSAAIRAREIVASLALEDVAN